MSFAAVVCHQCFHQMICWLPGAYEWSAFQLYYVSWDHLFLFRVCILLVKNRVKKRRKANQTNTASFCLPANTWLKIHWYTLIHIIFLQYIFLKATFIPLPFSFCKSTPCTVKHPNDSRKKVFERSIWALWGHYLFLFVDVLFPCQTTFWGFWSDGVDKSGDPILRGMAGGPTLLNFFGWGSQWILSNLPNKLRPKGFVLPT